MKMTDGKRTIKIEIRNFTGSGYRPDWSEDYFNAAWLPLVEGTDIYMVSDVDYCIDMACSTNPEEGACFRYNRCGELEYDPDVSILVDEI